MTINSEENVVRFDVAVNYPLFSQIFQGFGHVFENAAMSITYRKKGERWRTVRAEEEEGGGGVEGER